MTPQRDVMCFLGFSRKTFLTTNSGRDRLSCVRLVSRTLSGGDSICQQRALKDFSQGFDPRFKSHLPFCCCVRVYSRRRRRIRCSIPGCSRRGLSALSRPVSPSHCASARLLRLPAPGRTSSPPFVLPSQRPGWKLNTTCDGGPHVSTVPQTCSSPESARSKM
jgi:hypothetical protein